MSDVQQAAITERQSAINDAEKRMRSVDLRYMPVYPGGQKQFKEDCQVLAMAWMDRLLADAKAAEVDGTAESITRDWLRTILYEKSGRFVVNHAVYLTEHAPTGNWLAMADHACIVILETRADVLNLLRALGIGITPKETT